MPAENASPVPVSTRTLQSSLISSASSTSTISSLSAGLMQLRFSGRFSATQAIPSSMVTATFFPPGNLSADMLTPLVDRNWMNSVIDYRARRRRSRSAHVGGKAHAGGRDSGNEQRDRRDKIDRGRGPMRAQHEAAEARTEDSGDTARADGPAKAGRAHLRWVEHRRQRIDAALAADNEPADEKDAHRRQEDIGAAKAEKGERASAEAIVDGQRNIGTVARHDHAEWQGCDDAAKGEERGDPCSLLGLCPRE